MFACYFLACTSSYLGQIGSYQGGSRYLWHQDNLQDFSGHGKWPKHPSWHACMLWSCVHRPISQPNGVIFSCQVPTFVSKFLPVTIDKNKNKWTIQKTQKTLNNPKYLHEIMTVLNLSSFCWVQLNLLDKLHNQCQTHYRKDVSSRAGDILKTYLISVKKYYTARQTDI